MEIPNLVLSTLFARYLEQTKKPILVRWGSGTWRWTLFRWGMWLGDSPELQCLMGAPAGSCLRCLCPSNKMSMPGLPHPPKTNASRVRAIREAAVGAKTSWRQNAKHHNLVPSPILVADQDGNRVPTAGCSDKLYDDVRKEVRCHLMEFSLHNIPGFDAHMQVRY